MERPLKSHSSSVLPGSLRGFTDLSTIPLIRLQLEKVFKYSWMYLIVRNGAFYDVPKTRLTKHFLVLPHCFILMWTEPPLLVDLHQPVFVSLIAIDANL